MKKNYSLANVFSDLSDLFTDVFGDGSVDIELGKIDESPITTYIADNSWMTPKYDLKDTGDGYEIKVDYDENRDRVYCNVNKGNNTISLSIYQDWDKSAGACACTYYGKYTMTAPEDCDLEAGWEKEVDEKNNKLTIKFKKKAEKGSDEAKDNKCEASADISASVDYKSLYNDLVDKYHKEVSELNEKVERYELENKEATRKCEEIEKKLNDIKKMFS